MPPCCGASWHRQSKCFNSYVYELPVEAPFWPWKLDALAAMCIFLIRTGIGGLKFGVLDEKGKLHPTSPVNLCDGVFLVCLMKPRMAAAYKPTPRISAPSGHVAFAFVGGIVSVCQ